MSDIEVVFKDIQALSKAFDDEGARYDAIVPPNGPPSPTVTEGTLKNILPDFLKAIGLLHDAVGTSMKDHAKKLKIAHDRHFGNEKDIERLMRAIDTPNAIGTGPGFGD